MKKVKDNDYQELTRLRKTPEMMCKRPASDLSPHVRDNRSSGTGIGFWMGQGSSWLAMTNGTIGLGLVMAESLAMGTNDCGHYKPTAIDRST